MKNGGISYVMEIVLAEVVQGALVVTVPTAAVAATAM